MKVKSIKAITLSMPFSHGGKKVIFHGKEWKSLEFNLVKIETDKGITGWGEAFGYTSWKAVKIAIEEMVAPLLVGKDMSNIPELLLTLQKSLHLFGRYGITMFAISGVEIALWDALGKEKNKPIYELLGKKNKDLFKAYSSLFRYGDPKIIEQKCKQSLDDGYQAIKLHEIENDCIEAGRKGTGNLPLMLDTNCPWTYEETLSKKDFLKSMKLTWLEEPIYPPEDYETLAKLNKELGIPIACGENACTEFEFKSMIKQKAVTFVQPSVIKVGGIYEMFKIIKHAEKNNISVMPHTAYFGPGFLATLQLASLMEKDTYIERFYLDIDQELEKIYTYFLRLKERRKSQAAFTSGGEQQMIAVARAMMAKPKMLLLDEPTMGLAPQLVAEIFNIVKELNQKEGVSILLAEQNTNIALKNSDYGYIIETGKVMLEGTAQSLLNNDKVKELYLGISKKGRKNFRDVLKEESLNKKIN